MSTILQCRQVDSKQSNNNGDFTTMLDKPIKLDPGDSINIKSCFIDTKSENSTNITVEEDLDVSLTFGYYITNHVQDLVQCFPNLVDQVQNGKKYALYKKQVISNDIQYHIKVLLRKKDSASIGASGFLSFDYIDIEGNIGHINRAEIKTDNTLSPPNFVEITIYAKENSLSNFQFDYTNNKGEYKIPTNDDFEYASLGSNNYTTFYKNTITINVPKGKYTPTNLAQYLSSEFQKTNKDVKSLIDPTNNKLLLTAPEIVETLGNDNCYIISEDINNNSPFVVLSEIKDKQLYYYFGTPTLSFEYDNNTSKMKIDSCHLPIYDGINGNKIINILENTNTNIPYEFLIINQNAGIFFTDAQPTSFWFDKLGFTKDFIPNFKTDFYMTDPLGQTTLYYPESLEEGKYTTGQYLGLDILIPKIRPDSTTSEILYNGGRAQKLTNTITTINNPIIAKNPILSLGEPSGYFLIEVSGINASTNEMIGENYSNPQIKGIVSRYYTVNSYTSAGMESDIPFENLSPEPVYINSLNVRILNPDGTLAEDIDGDNTIFLQINRKQPLDPLITNNPKNEKNNDNDKKDK